VPPPANRIEKFAVTVPAGTAQASPANYSLVVPDGYLQRVEVTIPDGHNGLTGLQLLAANAQLVPATFGAYLVGNDQTLAFDMVGVIDTGNFQANAYNTGVFAHTFYGLWYMLDFAYSTGATEPTAPLVVPVVV
jgi:hypothetical protein